MRAIADLVQPHLRGLEAYTPGTQPSGEGWIKLNTNELPFPPPKAVEEAILSETARLARYPNPRSDALRKALARFHSLETEQVIVGNGSDDILNLLARAFGGRDRHTVQTFPSYSLYPVVTAIAGGTIRSIPFGDTFALPVDDLASSGADLLFLTCPNAPTGVRFPLEELDALAAAFDGLLVIDEAYAEFAEQTALSLLHNRPNVVITRTFSKAFGLAGLRVGYGLAAPAVISVLDRIRDSYNVNRLSQAGALAALGARDFYAGYVAKIKATRETVRNGLLELGWKVYPSEANFLFGAPVDARGQTGPAVADSLFRHLESKRILVRYFPKHPLTAPFLRISIGTESEMNTFMEVTRSWTKGA